MKKIKVKTLIVSTIPFFAGSRNYGGVADVAWNLAIELTKKKEDIAIFAIGKYFGRIKKCENIKIYGTYFNVVVLLLTLFYGLKNFQIIYKSDNKLRLKIFIALYQALIIKRTFTPSYINIHHSINQLPLALKLVNSRFRIITTIHSFTEVLFEKSSNRRNNLLNNINLNYRVCDYLTFVSKELLVQASNLKIQIPANNCVIYNGISLGTNKQKKTINSKEFDISFVGSFIERKGIYTLLQSLNNNKIKVKKMLWIGKGNLESFIKDNKKNKNMVFTFTGQLNKNEIYSRLRKCKLLVVPSKSESFGLVYIEALFCGIPVIGYQPALREFVDCLELTPSESDWLIGFNSNFESSETLVQKINNGLTIVKRSNYLSEASSIKEKILNKFSWSKIVEEYITVYKKFV